MDDNEVQKARSNLNISGYEHPDKISSSSLKDRYYKTYNSELTHIQTQATPDNVYNTNKHNQKYASLSLKIDKDIDNCPTCGEKAAYECDCTDYCKECKKGHIWYKKEGKTILGDPHIE